MAHLTVNYPNMEKDVELDIPPHGLFKNGHIYDVPALEKDIVVGEELESGDVLDQPKFVDQPTLQPDVEDEDLSALDGLSEEELEALAHLTDEEIATLNKDGK